MSKNPPLPEPGNSRAWATKRVILSTVKLEDAEELLAFHEKNLSHLQAWAPPAPASFLTLAFWQAAAKRAQAAQDSGAELRLVMRLRDHDGIMGTINLTQITRGPFHSAMLGYQIAKAHEGQGLMSEALSALVPIAFTELKLHRLQAAYVADNLRSARVLQRAGFDVIGTAKDYLYINGAWRDHVITQLIHREFDAAGILGA